MNPCGETRPPSGRYTRIAASVLSDWRRMPRDIDFEVQQLAVLGAESESCGSECLEAWRLLTWCWKVIDVAS
jgi:hypothetical protein